MSTSFFANDDVDKLEPFEDKTYWITVRQELTAGQDRAIKHAALRKSSREINDDGTLSSNEIGFTLDLDSAAFMKVAMWLVDWNVPGPDGRTRDISTMAKKTQELKALTPVAFTAIETAIDEHVKNRVSL